jgi:transposase
MKEFTQEELKNLDKNALITLVLSLQGQLSQISRQLDFLTEQIALMNQRSFGRRTDRNSIDGQISMFDQADFFNEAEADSDDSPEPDIDEITVHAHRRKKSAGKREQDLEDLPARIINHTIPEEKLNELFPEGYKELPETIYKRLAVIPQTFIVDEHHVHVYASKSNDGRIVRAERPKDIFRNSIATPSILAATMNGKYTNHQPIDRQSRSFKEMGVSLETNTLCNWMIKGAEEYLSLIYDELHKQLYDSGVIHADETPLRVTKDGRPANSKSYMWVYCNNTDAEKKPVVLFDYQKTRKSDHPREFLKDYSGIVVTDGYQVYHTIGRERKELTISGCWVHAKRKFSEITKALGTAGSKGTVAKKAEDMISEIFYIDSQFKDLSNTERKRRRNLELKPKVNAFFAWAKEVSSSDSVQGQTASAISYCLNQEQYLRVFLQHGDVPMDNNAAERAIRPFTLGRKNWANIDTVNGAKASAVIYSIVQTALANHLKVYDYLEYIFTIMPEHMDDTDRSFIYELLPWSKTVQQKCHVPNPKRKS